jgi:hypothetical protein
MKKVRVRISYPVIHEDQGSQMVTVITLFDLQGF